MIVYSKKEVERIISNSTTEKQLNNIFGYLQLNRDSYFIIDKIYLAAIINSKKRLIQ